MSNCLSCFWLFVYLFSFFIKTEKNKITQPFAQSAGSKICTARIWPIQNFVPAEFCLFKMCRQLLHIKIRTGKLSHIKDRSFFPFRAPDRTVQSGDSLEIFFFEFSNFCGLLPLDPLSQTTVGDAASELEGWGEAVPWCRFFFFFATFF